MPENNSNTKIHYQKPVFIKGRSNGQERERFSDTLKTFSGFVFLVSMKYTKDEKKAKQAAIKILKNFINEKNYHLSKNDIKTSLYIHTKAYFETQ